MKDQITHIKSIHELHQCMGLPAPTHPLMTIIDGKDIEVTQKMIGMKWSSDLFYIALKDKSCGMQYGRNTYDFEEGVLIFVAPHQVISATEEIKKGDTDGWLLFFHPDLFIGTELGDKIDQYSFFSYDANEALHLSDQERQMLMLVIDNLKAEMNNRIDNHSQNVMISNLELLLTYSSRYYERQFNTRKNHHSSVVTQVDKLLKKYYDEGNFTLTGMPNVQYFADEVNLSSNYLSDLLKKETGRSAKDHINDFVIDKAKHILLGTDSSISEVAYNLGFNYPHYFSRLFKNKTGMTPNQFRDRN
ncbi:helix-turn-helix transcriptional regulator [Flammeovirga yaeyamensis]|uniref:Helix-turn-helix transcriptional regulator n=1 Tax=Flammeovirga yaeyamensis TaxID=367791 RepID=A0AAX1N9T1_9BACT|nr:MULTISPECIES: AraC family transcriptional regulator [Flammeovirga]ANQ51992.2 helix-turn-helix transcriptional regulator [Flammeovirga sp. MY04]MBB3699338.1 AraC-like DNA-binding protein [Flammeovirga yaeyamensis]NMF35401.1 helix-turn-helix transcriptional regulator [Flammeovirga yaeyamensis]QWG04261.1 helix-turn-helix transcriptional regulator [Flammeovirga yaeyamensis]